MPQIISAEHGPAETLDGCEHLELQHGADISPVSKPPTHVSDILPGLAYPRESAFLLFTREAYICDEAGRIPRANAG
jgi:hypothetical protein